MAGIRKQKKVLTSYNGTSDDIPGSREAVIGPPTLQRPDKANRGDTYATVRDDSHSSHRLDR